MTPWQKRARASMAVLAIGVIAVVIYTMRPRQSAVPAAAVERLDPDSKIETIGGDVLQLKGERRDLRIEFKAQITDNDGQTRLRNVKVIAENRGGRNYTITGEEAQVGKDESSFEIKRNVRLETDDGLVANSQQATYTDAEKIVRASGPVTFSRGKMNGSGIGFTFDEQRDVLWILEQAIVHVEPDGENGPMDVTSGSFGYARRDRYMRFERTMHMDRDGQIIDATEAIVTLYPDRDEADGMELRGKASITGKSMGPLRSMRSRDMNLDYAEDGRTLRNATLSGSAAVELTTQSGSGGQRLEGESIDIGLEPDNSLRSLAARERVVVTLPAAKDTPTRTIRSKALTGTGSPQGLRAMKFEEGVEYREAASKTQGARTVRARTLDSDLEAASGELVQAHFLGNVEVTDGTMRATAMDAVYQVAVGSMALTGAEPRPHVENESLTIDANAIDVTLNPRTMTATGRVNSTLLPSAAKPPGRAQAPNRPGLLADEEPVAIVADKLTYDEAARKADYSGQARLLQGQTTINGDALTVDETKGDLIANGRVITTLAIAEKDGPADGKSKPMIGRAGSFTYSDQTRLAT
ncbi:MAG TPA: LPS export ABC transporter periplasmic protein LptC, partial [Vicinamibacterales bacterium]|nr:LPS export ABC transporter periplasmic protein LptC [Vicinamibacterales bacterium]